MSSPDRRRGFRGVWWPRGVRGRLVVTYLLAASVLAVVGLGLFTVALGRGLLASVDAALRTRADSIAADLTAAGSSEQVSPPPAVRATGRGAGDLQAITAVYGPTGRLVDAQPPVLPASPLTGPQSARRPTVAAIRTADYAGESFRILVKPVRRSDGTWLVVVGESLSAADEAGAQVRQALWVGTPVLLALVGVGAWLLSGAALKPVSRMSADAQTLGEHDSAGRIREPPTRDSLNQLAGTFNALLDRLHTSLSRQRTLVADAGHELRTPLAVLQTELETAVRPTRSRDDLVDSINHARLEVARLAALAEDLLLLAEADGGQPIIRRQLTDVSELLDDVIGSGAGRAAARQVTLTVDRPAPLIAEIDPVALRRILDNLLTNALRHTPTAGTITIEARTVESALTEAGSAGPQILQLRVCDTGTGFPPEFLPYAFDRFGRADQGRSRSATAAGSGLGLAIVATLTAAHGGTVTAHNKTAGGAVLEVQLPLPGDDTATGAITATRRQTRRPSRR